MTSSQDHDPLDRQKDGEPRFVLLGRDWLAPEVVRIWIAVKKRDESLLDAVVKRIKEKMRKRSYHPRDAEHVASANGVAINMELWLIDELHKPLEIPGVE